MTFLHHDQGSGFIVGGVVAILAAVVAAIFVFWLIVIGLAIVAIFIAISELVGWLERRRWRRAQK